LLSSTLVRSVGPVERRKVEAGIHAYQSLAVGAAE